jgi:hypothetical protein
MRVWLALQVAALLIVTIACTGSASRSPSERACTRTNDPQLCATEYAGFVANGEPVALCLNSTTRSWYFMDLRPGTEVGDPCGAAGGFEVIAVSD